METTVSSIKKEEKEYIKLMKNEKKPKDMQEERIEKESIQKMNATVLKEIKRLIDEGNIAVPNITKIRGDVTAKVAFPEIQKVKGSVVIENQIRLPEIQKIQGKVAVDFPTVQKVSGDVNARVKFPDFEKIFTDSLKTIKFPKTPEVQKIAGDVVAKVAFPEIQKIAGDVKTDIPISKGEDVRPDEYVPVRLTNGRTFYDMMTQAVSSNGKLAAIMREVLAKLATQTTGNTPVHGQKTIAVTNTAVALTSATTSVKNGIIVQALSGNSTTVHVGGGGVTSSNGFELQAGQATSIATENVSLIFVVGTAGDGVCFIGIN